MESDGSGSMHSDHGQRRHMHGVKVLAVAAVLGAILIGASVTNAADVMMVGRVVAIQVAADGKSAVATVASVKDGKEVKVTVNDKATLDLLSGKRIVPGDEVRLSYDSATGANLSKRFKKASGC
jgi:hypothetical protein